MEEYGNNGILGVDRNRCGRWTETGNLFGVALSKYMRARI